MINWKNSTNEEQITNQNIKFEENMKGKEKQYKNKVKLEGRIKYQCPEDTHSERKNVKVKRNIFLNYRANFSTISKR